MTNVTKLEFNKSYFLSDYRRKKIEKIKNENSKKLSLGAELVLYYALKKHRPDMALPPDIKVSPTGKPYIDGVYFSLSHSHDYAACAVAECDVGLDIEKINKEQNLAVGKKFLTDDELKLLTADNFFDFWTKKESFIKLNGFDRSPGPKTFSVLSGNFYSFTENGYYITAASEKPDTAVVNIITLE